MIDEKLGTIRDSINEVKTNLGLETTDSLETLVDTSENVVIPEGTLNITENGVVNVKEYESASVNVSPDLGTKSITENGTYNASDDNVDGYSQVSVNVSGGSSQEDEIVGRTISEYTNNRVSIIGAYAFYSYASLTNISFPQCTTIGASAFQKCTSLTNISFPQCTTIGNYAFGDCTSLTNISFPACTNISVNAFQNCTSLTTVSFPQCTTIGASAFYSCYNLLSLYLLGSSIPTLTAINAFSSTPISNYTTSTGGVYGSIIVQPSMMEAFQTATNWKAYSSRFSAWNGID